MLVVGPFELIEEFGRSCRPVTSSRIREIGPSFPQNFPFHKSGSYNACPRTGELNVEFVDVASDPWAPVSSKEANASTRFAFFSVGMFVSSNCRYSHV
jgi:hypothetical protein